MNRSFRPPPLARFCSGAEADHSSALADARARGFAEGRAEGILEGHASGVIEGEANAREALRPELDALREISAKQQACDAIAQSLRQLLTARDADLATLDTAIRATVAAALRTLFPTLLAHAAGAEIAGLLASAAAEREPEVLSLRAHPDTLAAAEEDIATLAGTRRVVPSQDARLPFGQVEIGWDGGGLTFDPAALLARITLLLTAPAPAPVSEQLENTP